MSFQSESACNWLEWDPSWATYDNYGLFLIRSLPWGLGQPTTGEIDMVGSQIDHWKAFGSQGAYNNEGYPIGTMPMAREHCLKNNEKRVMQFTVLNNGADLIDDKAYIIVGHSPLDMMVGA